MLNLILLPLHWALLLLSVVLLLQVGSRLSKSLRSTKPEKKRLRNVDLAIQKASGRPWPSGAGLLGYCPHAQSLPLEHRIDLRAAQLAFASSLERPLGG